MIFKNTEVNKVQTSMRRSSRTLAWVLSLGTTLILAMGCSKEKAPDPVPAAQTSLAAQPSEAEVVHVNRVEGEAFLLEWKAGSATPGEATEGRLLLTPKAPFKCNLEYPYKLKVEAPAVVELANKEITKPQMKVDAKQVSIPVAYKMPTDAQTIDGHLAFSVCTDDKCLIERIQLKMTAQAQ